jgi:O-antigen ligase
VTGRRPGFLHWAFPAMLGMLALTMLLSGRDLSQALAELQPAAEMAPNPVILWAQRAVSILLVAVSGERVLNHIALHKHLPSPVLALVFFVYWLATVAAPAVFGTHRQVSHEYLYTLLIGFAAAIASAHERDQVVAAARSALFLFLLAGVLLVPVMPALVLDTSYSQGLLPGVPRLGGLASHPVALGMFAQIFLLCLWSKPFERRWLNRIAWLLGLAVLFLAQSKTAWIAFFLSSAAMIAVRQGPKMWHRIGDPRQGTFGILACVGLMGLVLAFTISVLVSDIGSQATEFLETPEGAQLMTMTGRDQIWAIAMEEWHANPLFGYGPNLWDADFRASIGMPNATSAHNQFMDTLARSGTVGASALVLYAAVLLVMSVRYAKATGGFSLALFLAIALRAMSEVPLLLFGYGTELLSHLLLIVTLACAAGSRVEVLPARTRPAYGMAS